MSMGTLGLKGMASLVPNDDELDKRIRNYMSEMAQKDVFFLFFSLNVHPKELLLGVHQGFSHAFGFLLHFVCTYFINVISSQGWRVKQLSLWGIPAL